MLFFNSRRHAERLATSFRWLEPRPFPVLKAPLYRAGYALGAYVMELDRESVFAWETVGGDRRYSDFVLEADIEIDASNGHSAAGVLFRHVDDENFYSFLLSTRGNFRIDLLFNNHPLHLVEWTGLPEPEPIVEKGTAHAAGVTRRIKVVGHDERFSFHVDDEWVAELDDEILPSGTFGFAAQNFAGSGPGAFRLRRFAVESSPVAVEREHLRWRYYAPVSPASRLRLAQTLFQSGNPDAAAVQLRKALKDRDGTVVECFLLSQCYARAGLNGEALEEVEKVLAREPGHSEALAAKANLLYLSNRLLEARDFVREGLSAGTLGADAVTWDLLGNAEYGLGNWDRAAEAYGKAIELDPGTPLFRRNAARALERAGRTEEAVRLYLEAARAMFASEAFDDLSLVVPRVRTLAPRDPEARAMEAKMLFREGKTDDALAILGDLAGEGSSDSAVHYLLGLIVREKGERERALDCFLRAAELEPEFALYHFRVAETRRDLGQDPREDLRRALALSPKDPWANNLAGQLALEEGDPARAVDALRTAREAAPGEEDIRLNLAEALSLAGSHEEALGIATPTAGVPDTARAANLRGNIFARQGKRELAVEQYEAAIRMDPGNATWKVNCAAACIEVDMIHRAEELLAQVEPEHPSPSVYNLMGQVAALKGERLRAEVAYNAGLDMDPGNPDLTLNLALLQKERGKIDEARELVSRLLAIRPDHVRARVLLDRIRAERETRLACAACGREWWVPRDLPPQPAIRVRGEPPADAPAGRCPRCGKLYCVGCASEHLRDMRFVCPDCDEVLKLSEDALKWLLERAIGSSG